MKKSKNAIPEKETCADRFLSRYSTLQEAGDTVQAHTGRICDRQRVYKWRKQGYIPWSFAVAVEELTDGEITVKEIIAEATALLKA